jgi:hypothetical protein
MKTFYSILSVVIRPEINEKLSVGLLLVDEKQVSFYVSENKLSVIKKLVSNNIFKGIKSSIKFIEKTFMIKQNILSNPQQVLELNIEDKSDVFNYGYIDYLSQYNNNVIVFSKPVNINFEYSIELFQKLFQKLVDETAFDIKIEKTYSSVDRFKRTFYPKAKKYFNIEQEINSIMYPKLIMPVKMDLMGKNEKEVFAQSIDMSKMLRSIENGIANLMFINRALPDAKQFILASEPDKSNEVNHRIWNNIRDLNEFEYVDLSESGKITDYALKHGVIPLLEKI